MVRYIKIIFPILIAILINRCTFEGTVPTQSESNLPVNKLMPNSPKPEDKSINQLLVLTLSWESEEANKFDIYLDKNNPPLILIANDITAKSIIVTNLEYNTTYYWKVVAKFNDGRKIEGPIWSFTTIPQTYPTFNGYAMKLYKIETEIPNLVHVMFQVLDLNGEGVSTLTQQDFEIYEDGEPISPTESELDVKKRSEVPYKLRSVLMLDNSTSLRNNIDEIRNAAASFINQIVPQQEIAIYQFSENPEMLINFTSNKDSLLTALQKYQLGYATTNLYGAVIKGASLWNDSFSMNEIVQGTMIIFTDGKDTQGSRTLAEALNAIHNKIVFAIGLGSEIQPEILNAIGTAGYYSISEVNQLSARFSEIQESIVNYANSFYLLSYKSPKRGNNSHSLTIKIKNNPYSGDGSVIISNFNSSNFYSF